MATNNEELLIKITKVKDFRTQTEIDIARIRAKVEEEITEVKKMNRELKDNLDKINSTLVKIQYTLIGGALMVILSALGITEFIKQFFKIIV